MYLNRDLDVRDNGEVPTQCPFHKGGMERTPSFSFNINKNVGYCQTCNQAWTLYQLLKALGAPPEALKDLPKTGSHVTRLEDEPEYGVDLFDEEVLRLFRFYPEQLVAVGFDEEVLRKYEGGWDMYTKQITYPIRDHLGGLGGLSGRDTTGLRPAKYMPYGKDILGRGYPGFRKKYYLWGSDKIYALAMLDKVDKIVVTEGFKAAMWCAQCGYHAVAIMGTGVTDPQADLLETMGVPIVLFPDQDLHGYLAIRKIGDKLSKILPLRVVEYEGDEPDAVEREKVPSVIESAIPYAGWLFKQRQQR
jgi:DNA primase